jgi:hypothetical protein
MGNWGTPPRVSPVPTANALPNLLLPGQYHGHDKDGYADPQLECVLET